MNYRSLMGSLRLLLMDGGALEVVCLFAVFIHLFIYSSPVPGSARQLTCAHIKARLLVFA